MGWAARTNYTAQDAAAGILKPKPEKPIRTKKDIRDEHFARINRRLIELRAKQKER